MKGLLILALFLAYSVPAIPGSLLKLSAMIEDVTGMDALMNYGFYGCYCGWGGQGTPKDPTDWCCWTHDKCYKHLERKGCRTLTQSYSYRITQGLVTCEYQPFCPMQLCSCDKKLVHCLKRNLWSYNRDYQFTLNAFCS
ncbi:calcium-dependent phospholipase A2 [Fukomys damarensis]|uniref:Phospholipase A2 n=1 Tax=Fukomys damarensis TaxID=885580 RepID=A0A091D8R3_FUKDA|nr:calcium-dependent phospholipase A2 [Fukomys damarensis]XP_010612555.1 calcium-dependent phospholipase A2 [Fukomys damarensis]XP_019061645.1 calcium-dependent phospholipase A2 [Fukomys damarensis]XP_033623691.1 calcium-dependent phospholipase A2 [Fukomys damarensis]KFO19186.1 Calcium-dependent phospholipase A2 [Fukomys damarensis]